MLPELSLVIPVYNGSRTVEAVVEALFDACSELRFEIVLVNDGSRDDSEQVCLSLSERHPERVRFVQLSRNFGEHNAVLAGLNHARGECVGVLDDDGQNPPAEIPRLYAELDANDLDVVYGRYREKRHGWLRNLGSWFNDRMANVMLKKPPDLYLSSFKVMNRFVVDEITKYDGAFPYIDGLILRATANIGQIEVEHREREHAESNYTFSKLVSLWFNMFVNFSIAPLRLAALLGVVTSGLSVLLLAAIVIDKLYINPGVTIGVPTILLVVTFFAGVQLVILGAIGEYLGRLFLDHSKRPQFVVRYATPEPDGDG